MRQWLGVSGADPYTAHGHFFQFTNALGSSRTYTSFLQLLWLLGVWVIWNASNHGIFNNSQISMLDLLENVKCNSLWWLKAHNVTFVLGSQRWWLDPLMCLGIG